MQKNLSEMRPTLTEHISHDFSKWLTKTIGFQFQGK